MELMFDKVVNKSIEWLGNVLTLETGKLARQSLSSVTLDYFGAKILATVCADMNEESASSGFFPLSVHFISKAYSVGKVPGGFFKREGKPSDNDVLVSRLIDRSVRPMFPKGFSQPVVIMCQLLSYDGIADYAPLAVIAASAALRLSPLPFAQTVGAVSLYANENEYIYNPSAQDKKSCALELLVSSTNSSIIMVESGAKEYPEDEMIEALLQARDDVQPVIEMIEALREDYSKVNKAPDITWNDRYSEVNDFQEKITDIARNEISEAYSEDNIGNRATMLNSIKNKISEANPDVPKNILESAVSKIESDVVRQNIVKSNRRPDNRKNTEIRSIASEVNVLSSPVHGSSLFTRGETQAMATITLGNADDEQILDGVSGEEREHFLLHYNFWPFSVGEAAVPRSVSRRETGHGRLARKAILPLLPAKTDFPYSIRVVSEILESNGSSSMATVCATSMALMDAGVPVKKSIAGIAMGLVTSEENDVILSDIAGIEDHMGDMDFKVAGTDSGITALQMDMKIQGITTEILVQALHQAKEGRMHILSKMSEAISYHKESTKEYAPKIHKMLISKDKIKDLIGSGGKTIREISETTQSKIDIEQDGTVLIMSSSKDTLNAAIDMVKNVTTDAEPGMVCDCKIFRIVDSGYLVSFLGANKGLIPNSMMLNDKEYKIDMECKSLICAVDKINNRITLSSRAIDQNTGEIIKPEDQGAVRKTHSSQNQSRGSGHNSGNRNSKYSDNRKGSSSRHAQTPSKASDGYFNFANEEKSPPNKKRNSNSSENQDDSSKFF